MATDYHFLPVPDPTDPVPPHDELVWEILKWLPVKSLMRFKCVSKLWRSIILDPRFAREYRGGFRGVLVTDPFFSRLSPTNNFFYINLFDDDLSGDRLIAYHHTVNHSGRRLGFTEVVNGLLCFYCGNYSCLYNLATREGRDLPLSQDENKSCTYHLGFDPVNNLYKLLKICAIYEGYDYEGPFSGDLDEVTLVRNLNCEILTLGVDALWRSIDPAPEEMTSKGVCFNGVLYWIIPGIELVDDNDSLFAFDLAQEKFQSFSRPQGFSCNYLALFAPGLALFEVH